MNKTKTATSASTPEKRKLIAQYGFFSGIFCSRPEAITIERTAEGLTVVASDGFDLELDWVILTVEEDLLYDPGTAYHLLAGRVEQKWQGRLWQLVSKEARTGNLTVADGVSEIIFVELAALTSEG